MWAVCAGVAGCSCSFASLKLSWQLDALRIASVGSVGGRYIALHEKRSDLDLARVPNMMIKSPTSLFCVILTAR